MACALSPQLADTLIPCSSLMQVLSAATEHGHIHSVNDLKALGDFGVSLIIAEPRVLHEHGAELKQLANVLVAAAGKRLDARAALGTANRLVKLANAAESTAKALAAAALAAATTGGTIAPLRLPGGQHCNDFANFRQIAIVPSIEELQTVDQPFLPRAKGEIFLAEE